MSLAPLTIYPANLSPELLCRMLLVKQHSKTPSRLPSLPSSFDRTTLCSPNHSHSSACCTAVHTSQPIPSIRSPPPLKTNLLHTSLAALPNLLHLLLQMLVYASSKIKPLLGCSVPEGHLVLYHSRPTSSSPCATVSPSSLPSMFHHFSARLSAGT